MEKFEIFPAVFTGASTLTIQHVESVEPTGFPEEMLISGGGSVDPLMRSTTKADPGFNLTSRDLVAILAKVGLASGFPSAGKFQYRQQESGADYTSGSAHVNVTTPDGFLYIDDFGAKQNDKEGCDIKLKYEALYSGATAPATFNAGQALTSSVAITASHSFGPVVFEGALLDGAQSSRVKPGITTEKLWSNGGIWPTDCRIKERRPMIEVEGYNMTLARSLTLNQLQPITSGITCYYLKNDPGAGRVALNSAVHIAVTATAGAYRLSGLSGAKGVTSVTKIEVLPTAWSVTINTAVSLP